MKMTEQRLTELEVRVAELGKAVGLTTAENHNPTCACCKEQPGEYELDDTGWICEDCAQYMNDLGNEID